MQARQALDADAGPADLIRGVPKVLRTLAIEWGTTGRKPSRERGAATDIEVRHALRQSGTANEQFPSGAGAVAR